MEMHRYAAFMCDCPQRIPVSVPERQHAWGNGNLCSFESHARAPLQLIRRLPRGEGWETGDRGQAFWTGFAKIGGKVVVNAYHRFDYFWVLQAKCGTENAIEDFAHHTVSVLITEAEFWCGRSQNSPLVILIQAFRSHAI